MNNKLLQIASAVVKILRIGAILLAASILFFMVAWPLDIGFLDNLHVLEESDGITFSTDPGLNSIPLRDLGAVPFYFFCIKTLLIAILVFQILQNALRVIRSISHLDTFRKENVTSFRKMGFLFLAWMGIVIPSLSQAGGDMSITLNVEFSYAIYALICFVLAEIFAEGNQLMEEQKLTI